MQWEKDADGDWTLEGEFATYWVKKEATGWVTETAAPGMASTNPHVVGGHSALCVAQMWQRSRDAKKACERHYRNILEEEIPKLKELK